MSQKFGERNLNTPFEKRFKSGTGRKSSEMSLTNATPEQAAKAARISSRKLATISADARNTALDAIHDALSAARGEILAANARDVALATKSTANGELKPSILKRLDLGRKGKFDDMLQGIRDVRNLTDPGMFNKHLITTARRNNTTLQVLV